MKKTKCIALKINHNNSTLMVQCDAEEKCEMRFTTLCKNCGHNCGREKEKNCYFN